MYRLITHMARPSLLPQSLPGTLTVLTPAPAIHALLVLPTKHPTHASASFACPPRPGDRVNVCTGPVYDPNTPFTPYVIRAVTHLAVTGPADAPGLLVHLAHP